MLSFDKDEIKEQLDIADIFQLLFDFGGNPRYTDFGIISQTICHNKPGEGSYKLYYYENSQAFYCYTDCGFLDIYTLVIKVAGIQFNKNYNLNDAIRWVANRFNISGSYESEASEQLEDWAYLENYKRIEEINPTSNEQITLKEYNNKILSRLNYNVNITPWLNEGITQEVLDLAMIGFYPGGDQITIPHFDKDNRFIGLRGRTLSLEDAEKYGKYRPVKVGKQQFNHPLGMNLYGYNWNKDNIRKMKKVIVFESEKSVLKYASYFGWQNNISVACCGSNISSYQMQLLFDLDVEEVIVAFDKQYQELNTDESKQWKNKLLKIYNKYHQYCNISFMWDKGHLLGYKDSPIDDGKEIFLELFKERVIL